MFISSLDFLGLLAFFVVDSAAILIVRKFTVRYRNVLYQLLSQDALFMLPAIKVKQCPLFENAYRLKKRKQRWQMEGRGERF